MTVHSGRLLTLREAANRVLLEQLEKRMLRFATSASRELLRESREAQNVILAHVVAFRIRIEVQRAVYRARQGSRHPLARGLYVC